MDYEFPKEFDIIIVGTGVIESIISAAASRVGKRVLHLDENDYYGGVWASFNLENIIKFKNREVSNVDQEESNIYQLGNDLFNIKDFEYTFNISSTQTESNLEDGDTIEETQSTDEIWDEKNLLKSSRKFNIDLYPKVNYARGDFVELLISSNIARYSEFRSVSRILTWYNNQLEFLPCSRSDVFANTKVSVVEKRILMKLLTSLNDEEQKEIPDNKTFKDFLKEKKLTPNLIHYVLYGISMSTDNTLCNESIIKVKRFLNSLGRFGKTPFLFSMYGSGEIPQAFCRLSAVFGGIFALGQTIQNIQITENIFKSLTVNSQTIEAKYLIIDINKIPKQFIKPSRIDYFSRCILITDKTILKSEKENLTLVFYPPENGKQFTTLIELGTLTGTSTKGLYLVHLIAKQTTTPKEDFKHIIDNLFINNNDEKPNILWSLYFSLADTNTIELNDDLPKNIFVCPGPDQDLDYDFSIQKAKDIFNEMYPDLEFLPRAPDPEEIIIGNDEDKDNDNIETDETVKTNVLQDPVCITDTKEGNVESKDNKPETVENLE